MSDRDADSDVHPDAGAGTDGHADAEFYSGADQHADADANADAGGHPAGGGPTAGPTEDGGPAQVDITTDDGGTITIEIPVDAVTGDANISVSDLSDTAANAPEGGSVTVETSSGIVIAVGRTTASANGDPGAQVITQTVGTVIEINITSTADGSPITVHEEPITLTFGVGDIDLSSIPGSTTDDLGIFFWDVALGQCVEIPSTFDPVTGQLVALLDHLTVFAVMAMIPVERDISDTLRYYSITNTYLAAGFQVFFDTRGGLDRFGYPRSNEMVEGGVNVQWFQRGRLEWHLFNANVYRVQVGLVGLELLNARGIYFPPVPLPADPLSANVRYFPETGQLVSHAFLEFFDQKGGLDSFGLPISPELVEEGVVVQYFQRARFQYNPQMAGTPYVVQLGLIGDEYLMLMGRLSG